MSASLSLRGRALQLLAQREQSRTELKRKLTAHARRVPTKRDDAGDLCESVDPAQTAREVDAVLDWLEAENFASDERFVASRVNLRAARFGNLRIRRELAQHGVAVDAEQASALRDSELDRAWSLWTRRFENAVADASARARQGRFLAGRGFSPEVIARVMKQAVRLAADTPAPCAAHGDDVPDAPPTRGSRGHRRL